MIWAFATVALAGAPEVSCAEDGEKGTLGAFELLVVDGSPRAVARLAECLEQLDLPHVAQRHWTEVLRADAPQAAEFPLALGRTFALAEELGDPWSVAWTIARLDESALLPVTAGRDALLYVHAQHLQRTGQHRMAAEVLQDIDERFRWYPESLLLLGRAREGARQPEAAVDAYRRVVAFEGSPPVVAELAALRAARLFADAGDLDGASELLALMPAASPLYGAAQVVAARMWLDADRPDRAETFVGSARRAERQGALLPAVGLLEARLDLHRCRVRSVDRRLRRWEAEQKQLLLVVKGVGDTGGADGAILFAQHLDADPVDVGLPPGLLRRLDANREYGWLQAHLRHLDEEEARIRQLGDGPWQHTVGDYLVEVLSEGRERLRRMSGDMLLGELQALRSELERDLDDARRLRQLAEGGIPGC